MVGDVRWVLVPQVRVYTISYCASIKQRLMGRISGVVLEKCRDVIDVIIRSVHNVIFMLPILT